MLPWGAICEERSWMREETEGSDQGREEGTMTGEGWRGQPGNMKPRDPWSPLCTPAASKQMRRLYNRDLLLRFNNKTENMTQRTLKCT